MPAITHRQVACYLTPEQCEGLKRLSADTLVPQAALLRRAVDKLLADYHIVPRGASDEIVGLRLKGLRQGAKS